MSFSFLDFALKPEEKKRDNRQQTPRCLKIGWEAETAFNFMETEFRDWCKINFPKHSRTYLSG
jgi:hypothetical protein